MTNFQTDSKIIIKIMANVTIIYGSTTSNTESAAQDIAAALSAHNVKTMDVSNASKEDFESADNLILGTSTWGLGDIQDDWEGKLSVLMGASLAGKKVAFFGTGDSASYSDTFVDGIGILYEAATKAGAVAIGSVPTAGYGYSASRAEVDGAFVGLPIDDEDSALSSDNMSAWVAEIEGQFN